MFLVVAVFVFDVWVEEDIEEGIGRGHVCGEVFEGGAGFGEGAAEDEDAVGAVEGDFLFQVHDVGVDDAGDGCGGEDTAGSLGGALWVREDEGVLCGVLGAPVDEVGVVGYAVAACEFAACLEGLDELVVFRGFFGGGAGDFTGRGDAGGEEFGVAGVEVEKGFGDELAFGFVSGEE